VDLNKNFVDLADDELASYAAEVRAAFDALAELDTPTAEQVEEAESYADHLDAILATQEQRVADAEALAERAAALKDRFKEPEDTETQPEPEPEPEPEQADPEEPAAPAQPEAEQLPAAARSNVVTLSKKVARPLKPRTSAKPVVITAAADVPEFVSGSRIEQFGQVGQAVINRMRAFGTPSGDGSGENLQHYGVAKLALDFPEDLTIDRHSNDLEVLEFARREARLPGKSLTAAGGWCAPSETIYDLCPGETVEGILSLPEINVKRGGIRYTRGPSFAEIYAAPTFAMTEAQAIAGSVTKTCIDVTCPAFTEVRLDAVGLCLKVPILTQSAYPELIQRWISGSLVAFQHKMNARVLNALVAGSGAARVFTGLGATSTDTLQALELVIMGQRQKYRLGIGATLEVVVPLWVKGAIRADIARRNGRDAVAVTDAELSSVFSGIGANVQYVYDWQELNVTANAYPTTFNALVYPAGSWIKGTSDVINLNAVYDAASLAQNVYTALFMEQGMLVAQMCYDSSLVTLPVCNAGRTGAANLTCP
jgi:hypothetical protein